MTSKLGRIYKITNLLNDKEYVGYTFGTINNRLNEHKKSRTDKTKANCKLYIAMRKYGTKFFEIELLEEVLVKNTKELREFEGKWMKFYKCIEIGYNTNKSGESEEEKKEYIKKKCKEHYEENHDEIREKQNKKNKERMKDPVLREEKKNYDKNYKEKNKVKIKKQVKLNYNKNKEKILKRQAIKYTCICGCEINKGSKSNHLNSEKHIDFIKNGIIRDKEYWLLKKKKKEREKYTCLCGQKLNINGKKRHEGRKKHKKYLENLEIIEN